MTAGKNSHLADPVSAVFGRLCLSDWNVRESHLRPSWSMEAPPGKGAFYALRRGRAALACPCHSEPLQLQGGDAALLLHGLPHRIADAAQAGDCPATGNLLLSELYSDGSGSGLPEDGTNTRIAHGHFPIGQLPSRLSSRLPTVIVVRWGQSALPDVEQFLETAAREQAEASGGWQIVVERLLQAAAMQVLREHWRAQPGADPPESDASSPRDPRIDAVLSLIRSDLGRPWTVGLMARQIHMSKSGFSDRFRAAVGESPLQHLTRLRMNQACLLLGEADCSIKQVALAVGYESASSFSNAFKRWLGASPASFRKSRQGKIGS